MFLNHHISAHGSNLWKQNGEVWKTMKGSITILPPQDRCQVTNTHFCWNLYIQGIRNGFSRNKVVQLDRNGLMGIRNLKKKKPTLSGWCSCSKTRTWPRGRMSYWDHLSSLPNQLTKLIQQIWCKHLSALKRRTLMPIQSTFSKVASHFV